MLSILEQRKPFDVRSVEHGVEVPADKIAGLNRSEIDNLKHVPEDVGTGYVAILEVFHQLHCLVSVLVSYFLFIAC